MFSIIGARVDQTSICIGFMPYTLYERKIHANSFMEAKKVCQKTQNLLFVNLLPFATVNKLACLIHVLARSIKKTNHTHKTTMRWVFVA